MAPCPFLVKKWTLVYSKFFDLNGDKIVNWQDFEDFFQIIKAERGEASVEFRFARESMTMAWKGLLNVIHGFDICDELTGKEEVTLEQWDKMWEEAHNMPMHMPMWQWEYVKYMFLLLDTSGDKYIDVDEYAAVMKLFKVAEADSKKAFSVFAKHHKTGAPLDKIDYAMYVKRWSEYFTSEDEKAPGNALFGPLP